MKAHVGGQCSAPLYRVFPVVFTWVYDPCERLRIDAEIVVAIAPDDSHRTLAGDVDFGGLAFDKIDKLSV